MPRNCVNGLCSDHSGDSPKLGIHGSPAAFGKSGKVDPGGVLDPFFQLPDQDWKVGQRFPPYILITHIIITYNASFIKLE